MIHPAQTTYQNMLLDLDLSALTAEQAYRCLVNAATPQRLTQEQEAHLVQRARTGGTQEREDLIEYLLSPVERFARHYMTEWFTHRVEYLDMVQEGNAALCISLDQAFTRDTHHVIPYLLKTAYCTIRQSAQRSRSLIKTPSYVESMSLLSLDMSLSPEENGTLLDLVADQSPFEVQLHHEDQDEYAALDAAICALSKTERQVVVRHFGLYNHAPEPICEVLDSLGGHRSTLKGIAIKLCKMLKTAYPQYCSQKHETPPDQTFAISYKPVTKEQEWRLQEAHERLIAQGLPVTAVNLQREAQIGRTKAVSYFRQLQAQGEHATREERFHQALQEMQVQGVKVTGESLARWAHADKVAARHYLHKLADHQMPIRRSDRQVQDCLREAHVGYRTAKAFLQSLPASQPAAIS